MAKNEKNCSNDASNCTNDKQKQQQQQKQKQQQQQRQSQSNCTDSCNNKNQQPQ